MTSALAVGSWHLGALPQGWEVLPGQGLRRNDGGFPTVFLMAEERLPEYLTFAEYVNNQMEAAKTLLQEVKVRGPAPFGIAGATEALRVAVSHRSLDGHSVVHIQVYALSGTQVGNVTFTTIEQDFASLSGLLQALLAQLHFFVQPVQGDTGEQNTV